MKYYAKPEHIATFLFTPSIYNTRTHAHTQTHTYTHTLCTERIQCPEITIANGSVTISPPGRLLGSRTTYICDEGFTLVGDGNRICQADSTWSGDEVECGKCFLCMHA